MLAPTHELARHGPGTLAYRLRAALLWSVVACTSPSAPQPEPTAPTLTLDALAPTQCTDPLATGTAPALAGTAATATVVLDDLPSTFAVEVAPDGTFALPRADLTIPPDQLCPPDAPCTLPLTVSMEAVVDKDLVSVLASSTLVLDDDRFLRHVDLDGDGYGGPDLAPACADTPRFHDTADDCDDTRASARPDGVRIHCDGVDNDCVGGDEVVRTLSVLAEGDTPEAQLQWALENVDDGGQVILCDATTFVGSFEVDSRVAAMGPLSGASTFVADGGPALTVRGATMLLTRVAFDGGACLRIEDSVVELVTGHFMGCDGAVDLDPTSSLTWRRGSCTDSAGCLDVRGAALLDQVELAGNDGDRGGAVVVDGWMHWVDGACTGNTALEGGCLTVGPGAWVGLGDVDTPVTFAGNTADRGADAYVQGTLELVNTDADDVFVDGGALLMP